MTTGRLQAMGTDDADARRDALIAAVRSGGEAGVDAFVAGLGDADWRVRKEAVSLAERVASERAREALVAAVVQADNVGLRNAAIEAIGQLGESMVPSLVRAFESGEGTPQRFVVSALGMTASPRALPVLERALRDPDENLVAAAIDALARVGGPGSEAIVRAQLGGGDAYRRMSALDALDRMRAAVPFEELEPCLVDPVLRRIGLRVAGRTRSERAVPLLVAALGDRSATTVASAATALDALADASDELAEQVQRVALDLSPNAVAALRRTLTEGEYDARRAAAHLLIAARATDALPQVLTLAAESTLPGSAIAALTAWGEGAVAPLLDVAASWRGAVAALALELAADLAAATATSEGLRARVRALLRESVESREEALRDAALRSFDAHAEAADIPTLVRLASSSRPEDALRAAAVLERFVAGHRDEVDSALVGVDVSLGGGALCTVLAALGTEDALSRIVTCLSAADGRARRQAVLGVASAAGARAIETLALALADEDVDVRATAAMMLGHVRDDEGRAVGTERLLTALEHSSPVVQVAALSALVDLGATQARDAAARLALGSVPEVAAAAIAALRALGSERTPEVALEAAKSGDPEVVVAALSALADRALPAKAAPFVVECIDHPAWEARLAAIPIVRQMPDGRALLLRRLADEPDDIVRRALREATEDGG